MAGAQRKKTTRRRTPKAVEVARILLIDGKEVQALTAADVARLLGVSRQRVYEIVASRKDFPSPVARLARGSVWDRGAVEAWAARWDRRPGRPRRGVLDEDPELTELWE